MLTFTARLVLSTSQFVLLYYSFFYIFTLCSCRTGTYFLSITKESKQRSALKYAVSQPSFFSPIRGEEKTAGRNRFSRSVLSAVSKRVRHSALKQENTKC